MNQKETEQKLRLSTRIKGALFPWKWTFFGFLCFVIAKILSNTPEFTEVVYRNGLFWLLRWAKDTLFSWLPIPLMLLIFLGMAFLFIRNWKSRKLFGFKPWYRGIMNLLGFVVVWFYVFWGWNYSAVGIADKLGYADAAAPDTTITNSLAAIASEKALALRPQCDTARFFTKEVSPSELSAIHSSVREYLRSADVLTPGNVQMRVVSKSGWMRRVGISGIYMPFSAEAHTDGSYYALTQWFTLAHEYAHGYGITDEGECNFIAFMALVNSDVAELEYSAWHTLWMRLNPWDQSDSTVVMNPLYYDRLALREDAKKYPSFAPGLAATSNNLYLKSQGVEKGIQSYNGWVDLVTLLWEDGQVE